MIKTPLKCNDYSLEGRTFIDLSRAASLCGVSERTIIRHAQDRGIKMVQVGRKFFYMVKDFKQLIAEDNVIGSNTLSPR